MKKLVVFIDLAELRDHLEDTDLDSRIAEAVKGKVFPNMAAFEAAYSSALSKNFNEIDAAISAVSWFDLDNEIEVQCVVDLLNKTDTDLSDMDDAWASYCYVMREELPAATLLKLKEKAVEYVFSGAEESENFTTAEALFDEVMADETGKTRWDCYLVGEWQSHETQYALDWTFSTMKAAALEALNS